MPAMETAMYLGAFWASMRCPLRPSRCHGTAERATAPPSVERAYTVAHGSLHAGIEEEAQVDRASRSTITEAISGGRAGQSANGESGPVHLPLISGQRAQAQEATAAGRGRRSAMWWRNWLCAPSNRTRALSRAAGWPSSVGNLSSVCKMNGR